MKRELRKSEYCVVLLFLVALLMAVVCSCDDSGTDGTTTTPTNTWEPSVFEPSEAGSGSGAYTDSAHFRIYATGRSADIALAHMEAAYKCFVTDWGFRSTGLSTKDTQNNGPYYKTNIIPKALGLSTGGYMQYDYKTGLAYLEINSLYPDLITDAKTIVHEYGHGLTMHELNWVDQTATGAWWETVAQWVADTYLNSSYYVGGEGYTIIDEYDPNRGISGLEQLIGKSYYTIVHKENLYQAWPFLTYLTNNPDNYPGLGRMTVPNLFRYHSRNNETPLHVLQCITPISVQTILGRYWARMAYLDIGHPKAQQVFFNKRSKLDFNNLDAVGNQTYRVKSGRKPMYGGANIIPLRGTGNVSVDVTNLGNGLADSNFTATMAIRSSSTGNVRYVDLSDGKGQATVGNSEEASLVVVNTPDNLIQYNAFNSDSMASIGCGQSYSSPETIGLNYQVKIEGAIPTK